MGIMKLNSNKTVLFVFSLSAKKEAERKPLFGAHKKNISEHFFKIQNQKTLAIAKESGIDVIWLDEKQQVGNTFSQRFSNAFKSLFKQGYEKVISIGNDTPNLTTNHIKKAIHLLTQQQMVYGPSKDGGVYLLGYTRTAFNAKSFQNVSWLTHKVSKELSSFATKNEISFSTLEPLLDIDTKNSALVYAYANPKTSISVYILLHYIINKVKNQQIRVGLPNPLPLLNLALRGPPSFL